MEVKKQFFLCLTLLKHIPYLPVLKAQRTASRTTRRALPSAPVLSRPWLVIGIHWEMKRTDLQSGEVGGETCALLPASRAHVL